MRQQKDAFELAKRVYDSALLTFKGVDGYDVYNCSVPFMYRGKRHIFGRVERRAEWANSLVRLFVETGKDEYTMLDDCCWELEDPYIQRVGDEMVFGGTRVRKTAGKVSTYYGYFYRGSPDHLVYFTTGPDNMKDIRLVQLADKRIGVFSRKRTRDDAYIGFCIVTDLDELTMDCIRCAPRLDVIAPGEWGGVNQAYLLTSGKIGCIAHYAYKDNEGVDSDEALSVYVNVAFVLNAMDSSHTPLQVIGTKGCYPPCPAKKPYLTDCAFTSGIVMRDDGKCDLYSGLGDTCEGRITIDYPFEGHGDIIDNLRF